MADTNMKTIKLKYPVEFNSEKVESITFMRRAKYRDIKKLKDKDNAEVLEHLLVVLSQQPMELFDELDPVDIKQLDEVVTSFLGMSQT